MGHLRSAIAQALIERDGASVAAVSRGSARRALAAGRMYRKPRRLQQDSLPILGIAPTLRTLNYVQASKAGVQVLVVMVQKYNELVPSNLLGELCPLQEAVRMGENTMERR